MLPARTYPIPSEGFTLGEEPNQKKTNSKPQQCRNGYGKCHGFKTRELKQSEVAKSVACKALVRLRFLTSPLPPPHFFPRSKHALVLAVRSEPGWFLRVPKTHFFFWDLFLSLFFLSTLVPDIKTEVAKLGPCATPLSFWRPCKIWLWRHCVWNLRPHSSLQLPRRASNTKPQRLCQRSRPVCKALSPGFWLQRDLYTTGHILQLLYKRGNSPIF